MAKTNFKKLLNKSKLSQREFSRLSGINLPTVNQLYNNKLDMIHFRTLGRICHILDISPNDLFNLEWLPDYPQDATSSVSEKPSTITLTFSQEEIHALKQVARRELFKDTIKKIHRELST